jgi:hypothetical protein
VTTTPSDPRPEEPAEAVDTEPTEEMTEVEDDDRKPTREELAQAVRDRETDKRAKNSGE